MLDLIFAALAGLAPGVCAVLLAATLVTLAALARDMFGGPR